MNSGGFARRNCSPHAGSMGGEQFFTRARDFGFSKTPVETLAIWDKPAVLGDIVRVIRTFRPDVIITRFSPTQTNTHGHHTASAILGLEAFKLAADPTAYPEQLKTLWVWQARRILQNSGGPTGGSGRIHMQVGGDDPVLGLSFGQIAARSRAMHKSQGFANYALNGGTGGPRSESFNLLAGDPVKSDIMDDVDLTWKRFNGNDSIDEKIAGVISHFNPANPAASVAGLIEIKKTQRDLPADPILREKNAALDRIIQHCLGLTVQTTIASAELTPGEEITLTNHLAVTADIPVRVIRINALGSTDEGAALLAPAQMMIREMKIKIPDDQPVSQPYWLSQPAATGIYTVTHPDLIGRPENPPVIPVNCTFEVGGQTIAVTGEPRDLQENRRVEVIAPVSLAFPFGVKLFKPGVPIAVSVEATPHRMNLNGIVKLAAPAGWKVEPAERSFTAETPGQTRVVTFNVTPPDRAATADLTASIAVNGKTYDTGWKEIRYSHLPPLLLQPRTVLRAVCLDLITTAHQVGYFPGAGDSVAECIREMGCTVTILSDDDLDAEKLKKFDAVVIGVRAFNVRSELAGKAQSIFDYASAGGTVVEQYNRPDGLKGTIAPYSLQLSGSRITDETATMTFLAPGHPALHTPNKITQADFDGWIQERGIYFPTQWDKHWTPILGGSDPGEARLDGGLLIANCGQGHFVYTGLVFFRQLPAGVPGAYRLFANLISLGSK